MFFSHYIFWFILLSPITQYLFYYSADQLALQRVLATSDYRQAKRSMWTGVLLEIPMSAMLFFIGMVLFLISLGVNVAASSVVFRAKKRAERILS